MSSAALNNSDLVRRVLDCFPAGSYALPGLLRLVGIVESDEADTAAVECKEEPRLLVNPGFVAQYAETPEKLFMLIMHELHHILLGHTRLFSAVTELDNIVFDAVINAMLCQQFPGSEFTSFFTDLYADDEFPACLLRPPATWKPGEKVVAPPGLAASGQQAMSEVYRQLYSPAGASYSDLYEHLRKGLQDSSALDVTLLGDHSNEGCGAQVLAEHSDLLEGAVREAASRWPHSKGGPGRSVQDLLALESVQIRRKPSNRALLSALIRRIAGKSARPGRCPQRTEDVYMATTAMIHQDRRATVQRALGQSPMLYQNPQTRLARRGVQHRVHVYVDVSGSVDAIRGALYGAVLDCREHVHPAVHLFSTKVADVSFREMAKGQCPTTGGTDIRCVIDHMVEHKIRRAVLITDGYVGTPQGKKAEALRRVAVGVALTPGGDAEVCLEGFYRSSVRLSQVGN